jgi:CRP-like cAMP-binding protein
VEVLQPGREEKPVARLGTGQYFGEIGLLRNSRRTATVRAAPDLDSETEVMALDRAAFSRLINDSQMTKDEIAMVMRQRMLSTYETFLPNLRREAREMLLDDKDDD